MIVCLSGVIVRDKIRYIYHRTLININYPWKENRDNASLTPLCNYKIIQKIKSFQSFLPGTSLRGTCVHSSERRQLAMTLHFELVLFSMAIVLTDVYLLLMKLLSSCPWVLPGSCAISPVLRLDSCHSCYWSQQKWLCFNSMKYELERDWRDWGSGWRNIRDSVLPDLLHLIQ